MFHECVEVDCGPVQTNALAKLLIQKGVITAAGLLAKIAEKAGAEPRKLIAIRLDAKVSSHQRPTLRLERFECLERLEPVDS